MTGADITRPLARRRSLPVLGALALAVFAAGFLLVSFLIF